MRRREAHESERAATRRASSMIKQFRQAGDRRSAAESDDGKRGAGGAFARGAAAGVQRGEIRAAPLLHTRAASRAAQRRAAHVSRLGGPSGQYTTMPSSSLVRRTWQARRLVSVMSSGKG